MTSKTTSSPGSALLIVLVTLGVFLVLMVAGLGVVTTQKHALTNQVQQEQAFHTAECGSESRWYWKSTVNLLG